MTTPTKQELSTSFDQILDVISKEVAPEVTSKIASLKSPILNGISSKAAKDFNFTEAVDAFGLKYSEEMVMVRGGGLRLPVWRIEAIPETKGFTLTPCLRSLLLNYHRNFERSSEAVCRTALDYILNECLTVMKGNHMEYSENDADEQPESDGSDAEIETPNLETHARTKTPSPYKDVTVFGDVSFSHTISHPENGSYPSTIVNGRIDRSIGRVLTSDGNSATKCPKRRFHSLLLIVEAKTAFNLESALPQLVVYLASLHQSRVQRNRTDATVFGAVSDGYSFEFVTITHDGELKRSRRFKITERRGMVKILGCLKYILETSAKMSSNVTPEKGEREQTDQGDGDP